MNERICEICFNFVDEKFMERLKWADRLNLVLAGLLFKQLINEEQIKNLRRKTRLSICKHHVANSRNILRNAVTNEKGTLYDESHDNWKRLLNISQTVFKKYESVEIRRKINVFIRIESSPVAGHVDASSSSNYRATKSDETPRRSRKQIFEKDEHEKLSILTKKGRYETLFGIADDSDQISTKRDSRNEEEVFKPIPQKTLKNEQSDADYDYENDSDSEKSDIEIKETSPELKQSYFLVRGEELLNLFHHCSKCGSVLKNSDNVLERKGSTPIVRTFCKSCYTKSRPSVNWFGQPPAFPGSRAFEGNVKISVSAYTTGLSFPLLQRFCEYCGISMIGQTTYSKYAKYAETSVGDVYKKRQEEWISIIKEFYMKLGLKDWALACDAAFDSRGFCAVIGKTVLVEQLTGFVLHVITMHRRETNNNSGKMELEGLRRVIDWLKMNGITIEHICTDRSTSVTKLLAELGVKQKYDAWHLSKSAGNSIRRLSKTKATSILLHHMRSVKAHIWRSITFGNENKTPEKIPQVVNCLLHHSVGDHQWQKDDELTGNFTSCGHGPFINDESRIVKNSEAEKRLKKVILDPKFQNDLKKGDIRGTSRCEAKNALDRLYAPKDKFYPLKSHHARSMMSSLHLNEFTKSEMDGLRRVENITEYNKKYQSWSTKVKHKSKIRHTWRDEIMIMVFDKLKNAKSEKQRKEQEKEEIIAEVEDIVENIEYYRSIGLELEYDEDNPMEMLAYKILEDDGCEDIREFMESFFESFEI